MHFVKWTPNAKRSNAGQGEQDETMEMYGPNLAFCLSTSAAVPAFRYGKDFCFSVTVSFVSQIADSKHRW